MAWPHHRQPSHGARLPRRGAPRPGPRPRCACARPAEQVFRPGAGPLDRRSRKETAVMRSPITKLAAAFAGLMLVAVQSPSLQAQTHMRGAPGREIVLRQNMRKLWEDHVTWTRLVIVSTLSGLPDQAPTTERLLRNQTDIGNAIKPFYGDAAGEQLTALLRAHILGAAEILAAAKAGNTARLESAKQAWYVNGDDIARFLSNANPGNWPFSEMSKMMRSHLDLTLQEAVNQLQGRYAESVADYDGVHDEILGMSDMLSEGLIRQFPGKF